MKIKIGALSFLMALGCKARTMNESGVEDIVDSSGKPVAPTVANPITDCTKTAIENIEKYFDSEKTFLISGEDSQAAHAFYFINGQCSAYSKLKSNQERLKYVKDRLTFSFQFVSADYPVKGKARDGSIKIISDVHGFFLSYKGYVISEDFSPGTDFMCTGNNKQYCSLVIEDGKLMRPFIHLNKRVTSVQFMEQKVANYYKNNPIE